MGFVFPLFTNQVRSYNTVYGLILMLALSQMYTRLTFRWASTLFGCLGAVLALVPFILFAYGPQIRAKSRFARSLQNQEEKIKARAKEEA